MRKAISRNGTAVRTPKFHAKIHKYLHFFYKSLDIHVDYVIFAHIYPR